MPEQPTIAYCSIAEIRENHRILQHRYKERDSTGDLTGEIKAFIQQARQAGRHIGDDDERWTCQGYLDYWATTLYSHSDQVPSAVLEPFDEDSAPDLSEEDCPFVGLRAFEEKDATLFFGRETDSANLARLILSNRIGVVTGPSGAGKSSLIGAGLIPRLRQKYASEGEWQIYGPCFPGAYPGKALEKAEEYLEEGHEPKLLLVDQLEEIFTICSDKEERSKFINRLIDLARAPASKVFVVAAISDDFLDDFCKLVEEKQVREGKDRKPVQDTLAQLDECEKHLYRIKRIGPSMLRDIIIKPARLRNLQFEPRVVDSLVNDLSTELTALPLLQFSLMELWKRRKGNRIIYEHYVGIGGKRSESGEGAARKALAVCAERLYRKMPTLADQLTFKYILLRLTKLREDGEIAPQRVTEERLMELTDKDMADQIVRAISEDNVDKELQQSYTAVMRQILSEEKLKELAQDLYNRETVRKVLDKLGTAGLIRRFDSASELGGQIEIAHEVLVRTWASLRRWTRDPRTREELELERDLARAAATWAAHGNSTGLLWTDKRQLEMQNRPGILWRAGPVEKEFLTQSQSRAKRLKWLKVAASSTPFLLIMGLIALVYSQQWRVRYLESGLSEIMDPFEEEWKIRFEYAPYTEVFESLPIHIREHIVESASSNSSLSPEVIKKIDDYDRFKKVAGEKSECADVRLTRRKQKYLGGYSWSGFTANFKYPLADEDFYMAFTGTPSVRDPNKLELTLTQYRVSEAGLTEEQSTATTSIAEPPPVIHSPMTFSKINSNRYEGELLHPVLLDENEKEIPIARMTLTKDSSESRSLCD